MSEQNKIQLFENQPIRTAWNEEQEEWYFSVVDVIHVLTGSENPRRYWSDLKRKLKSEGATQLYENIVQLKMKSSDGKNYKTDAATTEQLLRIIQSIPSPRAEPVKRWLAEVGRERIEETIDPEQAIDRALETYLKKGYDPDWVHQRLLSIRIRNELTDEWQKRGVEKGREFAILTDEITRTWSGMTTRQYKNLKGLKKENLRDNMSDTELVLTMLAEASTRDISKASKPEGFFGSMEVARQGGEVAGVARKALEERTVIVEKAEALADSLDENTNFPHGIIITTTGTTGLLPTIHQLVELAGGFHPSGGILDLLGFGDDGLLRGLGRRNGTRSVTFRAMTCTASKAVLMLSTSRSRLLRMPPGSSPIRKPTPASPPSRSSSTRSSPSLTRRSRSNPIRRRKPSLNPRRPPRSSG